MTIAFVFSKVELIREKNTIHNFDNIVNCILFSHYSFKPYVVGTQKNHLSDLGFVGQNKNFNPYPHTTILQQTTLNLFCQKVENLYNWMDNLWQRVENIVAKRRNCTFCAISSFVTMFSKSCLLQSHQKASIWGQEGIAHLIFFLHFSYISPAIWRTVSDQSTWLEGIW